MPEYKKWHKMFKYVELGVHTARASKKKYHHANRFLGILNATPKTSNDFPDLFDNRTVIWRLGYSLLSSAIIIIRSLFYSSPKLQKDCLNKKYDVLFVSHLTNIKHLEDSSDFYFGDIPAACRKNGLKTCTLLVNHCKAKRSDIKKIKSKDTFVLSAYMSPLIEVKIFSKLFLLSFSLPFAGDEKFVRCAKFAQFDHVAMNNVRIHEQVNNVLIKVKPKVLVQTFEGHGWERMNALSAHSQPNRIKVLAYHHAVLFPGPRAIDFVYGNGADPDIILMAGSSTKNLFKEESQYRSNQISILGSVKNVPLNSKPQTKNNKNTCLIVPEGDISEIRLMASFGIETAKIMPQIKFVLRLHPIIKKEDLKKQIPMFKTTPKNFFFSESSLDCDVGDSTWLLYRASSVVLYGISHGLRPIYLNEDESISVNDPIPNSICFRKVVKTPSELTELIEYDLKEYIFKQNSERNEAIGFSSMYFTPLDLKMIVDFVKKIDN